MQIGVINCLVITHIFCTTTFGQSDLLQAAHLGAKIQYKSESQANCNGQIKVEQSLPPRLAKFALRWPGDRETKVFKLFLTNTESQANTDLRVITR